MRVLNLPARTGCPTSEELAAFIDGQLQGAERERIVEHLASCEDCYAVFAGVVDFNEQESPTAEAADDEEDEDPPAEVVPFPVKQPRRWQAPMRLAACLVAGVGGALLLYRFLAVPPDFTTRELLASAESKGEALAGKTLYESTIYRGSPEEISTFGSTGFLLGAYWTDLETVALSGDSEMLGEIARQAYGLVEALIPELDSRVVLLVKQLRDEPTALSGSALRQKLDEAERLLDAYFEREEIPEYTFGKWSAAAHLAALSEDSTFFARRKNRRYLAWLLRHHEDLFSPDPKRLEEELQGIRTAIRRAASGENSYLHLADRFESICDQYARDLDPYLGV